jgi:hypothetical protein
MTNLLTWFRCSSSTAMVRMPRPFTLLPNHATEGLSKEDGASRLTIREG